LHPILLSLLNYPLKALDFLQAGEAQIASGWGLEKRSTVGNPDSERQACFEREYELAGFWSVAPQFDHCFACSA
jgi:hypothetical protein